LIGNVKALRFYSRIGYEPDEIDPTRMDEGEDDGEDKNEDKDDGIEVGAQESAVDYRILSKSFHDVVR
jgi:hypothetical protein